MKCIKYASFIIIIIILWIEFPSSQFYYSFITIKHYNVIAFVFLLLFDEASYFWL
jgi:hypothetical protein